MNILEKLTKQSTPNFIDLATDFKEAIESALRLNCEIEVVVEGKETYLVLKRGNEKYYHNIKGVK